MKLYRFQPKTLYYGLTALVFFLTLIFPAFPALNYAQAADDNKPKLGTDGTLQVYETRLEGDRDKLCNNYAYKARLFASNDGGRTWQERGQQFNQNIVSVVSSSADARAVYAMVADSEINGTRPTFSIYFSADAGLNWEKRSQGGEIAVGGCSANFYNTLGNVPGYATPVNVVEYRYLTRIGGSTGSDYTVVLSADGGRTFNQVGVETPPFHHLDYYYTTEGFVRYYNRNSDYLTISTDGGKSWQPRTFPPYKPAFTCNSPICANTIMAYLPGQLFVYSKITKIDPALYSEAAVWYSVDNGRNWLKVADGLVNLEFKEFAPTTITGYDKDGKAVKLQWADFDRFRTSPANYNGAKTGIFFSATSHNLSGPFLDFWNKYGGLAQFGYPKTEPFYEYNPADGKVYLAQYFERNRFEYHPENAGTQYEVLLGLLGNQLTAERRAKGEGAFNRFSNQNYPGGIYFPETGHNLRNSFKEYWEAHGGLAIYGYPTSEEFYEVNPDDGRTYVVQYFERNRFEYHPENKGTQYEVLLGLLGNTLLKQRGWLPS